MSAVRLAARAVVVSALGFTLVPVLGVNPAYACSCIQSTEQENYERADVVFKGTMNDMEAVHDPSGRRYFSFTPSKTYKGKTDSSQLVSTAQDSAACGVDLYGSGPFLVFANKADDPDARADLTTSLCSGTREIRADEDPDFTVNKATKVDEGPSEPTPPVSAEEPKGRTSPGSSGGGEDPNTPPCCKPMVDPDEAPSAPDAEPLNDPAVDQPPVGTPMPADGDAVDTPLMMQTGAVANDSAAAGESVNAAADNENTGWAVAAAAAALAAWVPSAPAGRPVAAAADAELTRPAPGRHASGARGGLRHSGGQTGRVGRTFQQAPPSS